MDSTPWSYLVNMHYINMSFSSDIQKGNITAGLKARNHATHIHTLKLTDILLCLSRQYETVVADNLLFLIMIDIKSSQTACIATLTLHVYVMPKQRIYTPRMLLTTNYNSLYRI
jgi:hypothetical protein